MTSKTAAWILKKWGWTVIEDLPPEKKCIILGVPHTSIMDFVAAYMYCRSCGGKFRCMVKKEFFFPPLSWLLRSMGGFPVDRKNPAAMLRSLIEEMERCDRFILAIAPEGTRKPVKRWKAGFHLIAQKTGVPVYMGYFDWGAKRIGSGPKFEITDDTSADMARLQKLYEEMHLTGKHPEGYITR